MHASSNLRTNCAGRALPRGTCGNRRSVARRASAALASALSGSLVLSRSSCLHRSPAAVALASQAGWTSLVAPRWAELPGRAKGLQHARKVGLFPVSDRSGEYLSEDELMWTGEYVSGGSYEFWSLGRPKRDFVRLVSALPLPEEGLAAAVLGCGLGVEVDHLARAAHNRTSEESLHSVVGVDFAVTAIDRAKEAFGQTPGAFFCHADVCKLPVPSVPLDLLVDNTVFQNVRGTDREGHYLDTLRRISKPGHTVAYLSLMSREGIERRAEFAGCMESLNLPLLRKDEIIDAFSQDWTLLSVKEGLYDLKPEGAGFECDAFYSYGGDLTPGIPSWELLLLRKHEME